MGPINSSKKRWIVKKISFLSHAECTLNYMFLLYTRISKINIAMLLIKYLKFKFCGLKLYIKNNFIDRIVNNIQFEWNLVVFFFFLRTKFNIMYVKNM